VDRLAHLFHRLVELIAGLFQGLAARIGDVRHDPAAFLDAVLVGTVFQFDSLALKETADVLKQFVFVNWAHK